MSEELNGLRWEPAWMSQAGCLKGCLDFLDVRMSCPRLYGLTGFAFFINMHEVACPSGPTAWRSSEIIRALLPNLGVETEQVVGSKGSGNLAAAQANAWEVTRRYLDAGLPVYGWEFDVPEYYVVHGYDHVGYHYRGPGCEEGAGPKPWEELGDTEIGVLCVTGLKPCPPLAFEAALLDALDVAVRYARPDSPWCHENYTTGPAAFDVWAQALESGTASGFGHRYCAAVWSECRNNAVAFLTELTLALEGAAAEASHRALIPYRRVADLLDTVRAEYPFTMKVPDGQTLQSTESADMLREAGEAEAQGLHCLRGLAESLQV